MKRVLITGMSGTGKSSLIRLLASRGYAAVDFDEPGWTYLDADGHQLWKEDAVRRLLSDAPQVLFVSGCSESQTAFYKDFTHVILLSAPRDVIIERLATRRENPYGKRPEELRDVLGYIDSVEPLLRRGADLEVDTTAPPGDVLDAVLRLVGLGDHSASRPRS